MLRLITDLAAVAMMLTVPVQHMRTTTKAHHQKEQACKDQK
jgi:hypothetical protein